MKLMEGVIVVPNGADHVLVTAGAAQAVFSGMIVLNDSATRIVQAMQEETTEQALVEMMKNTFDISEETARGAVARVLGQLTKLGLIIQEEQI